MGFLCTPSLHERICSRASARQDACKETGQAAICTGWADWPPAYPRRLTVNFQVTVLKVLVSYPDGFASLSDLERDVVILVTVVGAHHHAGGMHARARNLRKKVWSNGATVAGRLPRRGGPCWHEWRRGPRAQVAAPDSPTAQPGLLAATGADRRRPQWRKRRRASNEARHTSKAS